jgi:predicted DCC family thiol-disulfide oxidoreductase YuxK
MDERDSSGTITQGPILFYDGQCGLCARSVRWCLRHERRGSLRFAPLQGSTYAALARPDRLRELESMVLLDADGLHLQSEAALRLLELAGGGWSCLARIGRALPRPLREGAYRWVARHRRAWFGTAESCPLPGARDSQRFLP